jgi:hypothetical protein
MTRNTSEAARGAGNISANIAGVAQAAEGTSSRAQESQKAAEELASIATQMSSLMRQFKIERIDPRFDVSLPVRLTATDVDGHPLDQKVMAINVSQKGAQLTGIRAKLRMGSHVSLSRSQKREQFLIIWLGDDNTPRAGEIGLSAVDPACSFWNDVLEPQSQDNRTGTQETLSKPQARARGA